MEDVLVVQDVEAYAQVDAGIIVRLIVELIVQVDVLVPVVAEQCLVV